MECEALGRLIADSGKLLQLLIRQNPESATLQCLLKGPDRSWLASCSAEDAGAIRVVGHRAEPGPGAGGGARDAGAYGAGRGRPRGGLRLCVNQDGQRVYGHDVNRLTVIATESYQEFADRLGLRKAAPNTITTPVVRGDVTLRLGWVRDASGA